MNKLTCKSCLTLGPPTVLFIIVIAIFYYQRIEHPNFSHIITVTINHKKTMRKSVSQFFPCTVRAAMVHPQISVCTQKQLVWQHSRRHARKSAWKYVSWSICILSDVVGTWNNEDMAENINFFPHKSLVVNHDVRKCWTSNLLVYKNNDPLSIRFCTITHHIT